jgi:hypothetical protein
VRFRAASPANNGVKTNLQNELVFILDRSEYKHPIPHHYLALNEALLLFATVLVRNLVFATAN